MKILFATDGSDTAQQALTYLLSFPLPRGSELTLVTVIEKEIFREENDADINDEYRESLRKTREMLEGTAEAFLQSTARQVSSRFATIQQVRYGHPAEEIVKAAKENESDLVVMGSHGFGGVRRFLLGSVSDQVLTYAKCSVLIVRPDSDGLDSGISRVLLAYDDSPHAKRAASFCASLPLNDTTEVTVLTVLPLITLFRQDIKQQMGWMWQEKKRLAERGLAWVKKDLDWSTDRVVTMAHENADVSQEILDVAQDKASDLIVLGDKGTRAIRQFLMGSSTRRIAHHAPCSVLSVKQKQ